MELVAPVAAVLAAYLLGSLAFAVIVSRVMGLDDPRTFGSKNPGATNVLRSGSKPAALLTLALDVLKGYLPVWLVLAFGARWGLGENTAAFVGLAAFVGHVWPVFFRFKGGKGVATAAGVLMALNPLLGLATLASFALIVAFSRYVSLASIVAALFAPFFQLLNWGGGAALIAIVPMSLILIWRHEGNIRKLLAGTENKLGQKSSAAPSGSAHAEADKHSPHRSRKKH
jgi:acyl phosphate:glycerol-3-phosphate acyltransferase